MRSARRTRSTTPSSSAPGAPVPPWPPCWRAPAGGCCSSTATSSPATPSPPTSCSPTRWTCSTSSAPATASAPTHRLRPVRVQLARARPRGGRRLHPGRRPRPHLLHPADRARRRAGRDRRGGRRGAAARRATVRAPDRVRHRGRPGAWRGPGSGDASRPPGSSARTAAPRPSPADWACRRPSSRAARCRCCSRTGRACPTRTGARSTCTSSWPDVRAVRGRRPPARPSPARPSSPAGRRRRRQETYLASLRRFPAVLNPRLLEQARQVSPVVVVPETMLRGFVRPANGPGWALVGDAGLFKHPVTAQGIGDALAQGWYVGQRAWPRRGPRRLRDLARRPRRRPLRVVVRGRPLPVGRGRGHLLGAGRRPGGRPGVPRHLRQAAPPRARC